MLDSVVGEVTKKLAQRLGPVQDVAVQEPFNLDQADLGVGYIPCYTHGNRE